MYYNYLFEKFIDVVILLMILTKYYDCDKNLKQKLFVEKIFALLLALIELFLQDNQKARRPIRAPIQDIYLKRKKK